jgi:hypothetical protein
MHFYAVGLAVGKTRRGVIVQMNIQTAWRAWYRSLGVLARSPAYVILLALIAGLWGLGGYKWLALSESSGWVLTLTVIWFAALVIVALGVLAGSVGSVTATSLEARTRLPLRKILSFERKRFWRTALMALAGLLLIYAINALFGWINDHALTVASFLTFHLQLPVSYLLIGKIFWVIEALFWISFAGFSMTWLLALSGPKESVAPQTKSPMLASSFGLPVFLTGLVSAIVFGGLAWLVATWHPVVKAGGWDYAQLTIRMGTALLLVTLGWLFWSLALAYLALPSLMEPAASPPSP